MGIISRFMDDRTEEKSLDEIDEERVNEAMDILQQEEGEVTKDALRKQANHLLELEEIDEGEFRMGVVQDATEQEMSDRDIIAPNEISEVSKLLEDGYMVRNNQLVRIIEIHGYPKEVSIGWLEDLYSSNKNIRITQHIVPRDTGSILRKLQKRLNQLRARIARKKQNNRTDIHQEEADRDLIEQLIWDVITGESTLFDISVYIEVVADNKEQLIQLTEDVSESLGRLNADLATLDKRQVEAQDAVAPLAKDPIKSRALMQETAASTMFPFIGRDVMNPDGVLYGFDATQSPVMADRYEEFSSAGEVVAGKKGSGKTFSVIDHICKRRYIDTDNKFLIADPMGDFSDFADDVDGTVVHLGGDIRINPMEIRNSNVDDEREDPFISNIRSLIGIVKAAVDQDLTRQQEGLLRRICHLAYYKYGITQNRATHSNTDPTFEDVLEITDHIRNGDRPSEFLNYHADANLTEIEPLVENIEQRFHPKDDEVAQRLYTTLESFQQGGVNSNFNGRTNVDLNSDIIVFDMSMFADSGSAPLFLHVMLDWIYQRSKVLNCKVHAIFDEVHYLLNRKSTQDLLDLFLRHCRHWDTSITLITQTVDEFLKEHNHLENDKSRELYQLCKIKRIFRHDNVSRRMIDFHDLSSAEEHFIQGAAQGEQNPYSECLFVVGSDIKKAISVEVDEYTRHLVDEALDPWEYVIENGIIQPKDVVYLLENNRLHEYYNDIPKPVLQKAGLH
jgi:hypothetical protein